MIRLTIYLEELMVSFAPLTNVLVSQRTRSGTARIDARVHGVDEDEHVVVGEEARAEPKVLVEWLRLEVGRIQSDTAKFLCQLVLFI